MSDDESEVNYELCPETCPHLAYGYCHKYRSALVRLGWYVKCEECKEDNLSANERLEQLLAVESEEVRRCHVHIDALQAEITQQGHYAAQNTEINAAEWSAGEKENQRLKAELA